MAIPDTVEALITGVPASANLATSVDDRPHVAPVWYGYRDGVVYFETGGRKLANLRRNPRVALSVESARDGDVGWHVTLLGRATVVDDPERQAWARGWIYGAYDGGSEDPVGKGSGDDVEADGGESGDALVEVVLGSAAWTVYG